MADTAVSAPGAAGHAPLTGGIARPDFEIVPRKGLVLVAIMAVLVIAAIAANKLWPLQFLHVAGGAAWTIIDLFLGLVLGPIMGRLSVPARVEFTTRSDAEDGPDHAHGRDDDARRRLAAVHEPGDEPVELPGPRLGRGEHDRRRRDVVLALGLLEPRTSPVLVELKKPRPRPEVIEKLMKRFIYCAGVLGLMQIATLLIMTKLASG